MFNQVNEYVVQSQRSGVLKYTFTIQYINILTNATVVLELAV